MKKRKRNWKQILCVCLLIVSVFGIVGLGLGNGRSASDPESGGVVSPGGSDGSTAIKIPGVGKIGFYRDAKGTLDYTYVGGNYTKFTNDQLGFEPAKLYLGNDPTSSFAWNTVMYDRDNPYLYVGKDSDGTNVMVKYRPVDTAGNTLIFETDLAWLGSKGAGENCSNSNPTWHASIGLSSVNVQNSDFITFRFYEYEDGMFALDVNNKQYYVGYFNIGEWYNFRVEVTCGASEEDNVYKVYVDNELKVTFTGVGYRGSINPSDWNVQVILRADSLSGGFYLDNTYVSNK